MKKQPFFILFLGLISYLPAQPIEITDATILISKSIKAPVRNTLVTVLQEEVGKRSAVCWNPQQSRQGESNLIIAIALSGDKHLAGQNLPNGLDTISALDKPEGYWILSDAIRGKNIIWIIGADSRATLFGVGWLLRRTIFHKNKMFLEGSIDFATSPDQAIRGHQLGYRNTANSYDAWDVLQYEQYIRELLNWRQYSHVSDVWLLKR